MAYDKQTWVNGEVITAEKLNHMEDGIAGAGGSLIVNWVDNALDKTVAELYAAYNSGTPIFVRLIYGSPEVYEGLQRLAPVILLYNYNYANNIRVVVAFTQQVSLTGKDFTFTPATAIFSAESTTDYPEFYCSVKPSQSALI